MGAITNEADVCWMLLIILKGIKVTRVAKPIVAVVLPCIGSLFHIMLYVTCRCIVSHCLCDFRQHYSKNLECSAVAPAAKSTAMQ